MAPWPGSHAGDSLGCMPDGRRSLLLCHCIWGRKEMSAWLPSSSPASPPSKQLNLNFQWHPLSIWSCHSAPLSSTRAHRSSRETDVLLQCALLAEGNQHHFPRSNTAQMSVVSVQHTAQEKQKPFKRYLSFLNSFLGTAEELLLKYFKKPYLRQKQAWQISA